MSKFVKIPLYDGGIIFLNTNYITSVYNGRDGRGVLTLDPIPFRNELAKVDGDKPVYTNLDFQDLLELLGINPED